MSASSRADGGAVVLRRGNGERLRLGNRLGEGGEGVVHQVLKPRGHAVKRYGGPGGAGGVGDPARLQARQRKVEAMVQAGLARLEHEGLSHAAFPLDTVHDADGAFVGFLMRVFDRRWPLHEVYSPQAFRTHFAGYDYRFLVKVAGNIARAVANIHKTGCVIGDVNASGMLVSDDGTVALVDADSFQFESGGQRFFCEVGQGEYTPPELQGRSFAGVWREPGHDTFGLAVLIFRTLMQARHPFAGVPQVGDVPALEDAIARRCYAYAENRHTGLRPPPGMWAVSAMSEELAMLFSRAFDAGTPAERPSAVDWVAALDRFESTLVSCRRERTHWYPGPLGQCPWCARKAAGGIDPFPAAGSSAAAPDSVQQARPQFFRQKTYRPPRRPWLGRLLLMALKLPVLPLWLLGWVVGGALRCVGRLLAGLWRHKGWVLLVLIGLGVWLTRYDAQAPLMAHWRGQAAQALTQAQHHGVKAWNAAQGWARALWPAGGWPFGQDGATRVSPSPAAPARNAGTRDARTGLARRSGSAMAPQTDTDGRAAAPPYPLAGDAGDALHDASEGARAGGLADPQPRGRWSPADSLAVPQPDRPGARERAAVRDASGFVAPSPHPRQATHRTVTDKVLYMQRVLRAQGYPVSATGSFDRGTRRYALAWLRGVQGVDIRESQSVNEFYTAFLRVDH